MPEGSGLYYDKKPFAGDGEGALLRRTPRHRSEPNWRPSVRKSVLVGIVVWSLYVAACLCPVYDTGSLPEEGAGSGRMAGWMVLLIGWMPLTCVPWSANVFLLGGWVAFCLGSARTAASCGALAVILGLTSLVMGPKDFLYGYYLWQASLTVFAVAVCRQWRQQVRCTPDGSENAEQVAADVTMDVKPRLRDDGR